MGVRTCPGGVRAGDHERLHGQPGGGAIGRGLHAEAGVVVHRHQDEGASKGGGEGDEAAILVRDVFFFCVTKSLRLRSCVCVCVCARILWLLRASSVCLGEIVPICPVSKHCFMTAVLVYTRSMKNMVPNPDEVPHAKVRRSIFHGWLRRSFFRVVLVFRFRRPQAPEDEARDILCGVILSHVPVVSGRSRLLFCVLPDPCEKQMLEEDRFQGGVSKTVHSLVFVCVKTTFTFSRSS